MTPVKVKSTLNPHLRETICKHPSTGVVKAGGGKNQPYAALGVCDNTECIADAMEAVSEFASCEATYAKQGKHAETQSPAQEFTGLVDELIFAAKDHYAWYTKHDFQNPARHRGKDEDLKKALTEFYKYVTSHPAPFLYFGPRADKTEA